MELKQYWTAIQTKVCSKCIDGDGNGNCRLPSFIKCPLRLHLPLLVGVVERTNSANMEDYTRELRAIVCADCEYQGVNGYCALRTEVECALNRYFPLVIEAIEGIEGEAFAH